MRTRGSLALLAVEAIAGRIIVLRGERVLLDADLAVLYGVRTKVLNQAIKRNADRFPEDFVFRLTPEEKTEVVTNCDHLVRLKFSYALPYAFSEHGAIMAANVLNSTRAIQTSVHVVRAFVRLRQMISTNKELAKRLDELEARYDRQFKAVFDAIRELMAPPEPAKKRRIGFISDD
ncbi:MAG: ORF6N domain-containing protein [Burkholderiales bacterium]